MCACVRDEPRKKGLVGVVLSPSVEREGESSWVGNWLRSIPPHFVIDRQKVLHHQGIIPSVDSLLVVLF